MYTAFSKFGNRFGVEIQKNLIVSQFFLLSRERHHRKLDLKILISRKGNLIRSLSFNSVKSFSKNSKIRHFSISICSTNVEQSHCKLMDLRNSCRRLKWFNWHCSTRRSYHKIKEKNISRCDCLIPPYKSVIFPPRGEFPPGWEPLL